MAGTIRRTLILLSVFTSFSVLKPFHFFRNKNLDEPRIFNAPVQERVLERAPKNGLMRPSQYKRLRPLPFKRLRSKWGKSQTEEGTGRRQNMDNNNDKTTNNQFERPSLRDSITKYFRF